MPWAWLFVVAPMTRCIHHRAACRQHLRKPSCSVEAVAHQPWHRLRAALWLAPSYAITTAVRGVQLVTAAVFCLLAAIEFLVACLCQLCWVALSVVLVMPRIQHQQVEDATMHQEVLVGLAFDVFRCQQKSKSVLAAVTRTIMHKYRLLETFSINPATFNDFLMDLEQHYDPSNAYHNSVHVADVLQTLSVITSGLIAFDPTPTELLLLFLAAACHDVGHKGLNNPFYEEAKIRHDETARADAGADLSSVGPELSCYAEYAAEAGDGGANEYHHATLGWQLLERHGVLGSLGVQEKAQAEHLFKALILATNMQRHHDVLAAATDAAARPSSLGSRTAVLSALVHIADIFNPCRPVDIAIRFGTQVALESAAQGVRELELFGSIIHPYCNISQMNTPQGQKAFICANMLPALACLRLFAPEVADAALANLPHTMAAWDALQEAGLQQPLPDADRTVSQMIEEVKQLNKQPQQQQHLLNEAAQQPPQLQQEQQRRWQLNDECEQVMVWDEPVELSRNCSMSAGSFTSSRGNSFPAAAAGLSATVC